MGNIMALVAVVVVMVSILGGITLLTHVYSLNGIKNKTVGNGQHGTARWATKKEIHDTYRKCHSIRKNGVKETVCQQNKVWSLAVKELSSSQQHLWIQEMFMHL